ncbi:MAG: AEC family transporter, partial [Pseudomonadota bacterium]|nr:AEC family transporter [Pseudomonadota bacterium]
MIDAIILALAPVFFVMLLGYAAGKLHIVENHHVDSLNILVMSFALPASLFVATASAPREEMFNLAPLFFILGTVMLAAFYGWYFFARWSGGASRSDASLQALTIAFPNLAGVGLPIAASVIGPSGTVPVALALAAGSIIVSPLSLIIVELDTRTTRTEHEDTGTGLSLMPVMRALWRAVTKPIVLGPALGILASLLELQIGPVPKACLSLIGNAGPGI